MADLTRVNVVIKNLHEPLNIIKDNKSINNISLKYYFFLIKVRSERGSWKTCPQMY